MAATIRIPIRNPNKNNKSKRRRQCTIILIACGLAIYISFLVYSIIHVQFRQEQHKDTETALEKYLLGYSSKHSSSSVSDDENGNIIKNDDQHSSLKNDNMENDNVISQEEEGHKEERKQQEQEQEQKQEDYKTHYHFMEEETINDNRIIFDRAQAEKLLDQYGVSYIREVLTAYAEPFSSWNDTIPGTGSVGDMSKEKDRGFPPQFKTPLPLRSGTNPMALRKIPYPKLKTCRDIPAQIPTNYYNASQLPPPYPFPFLNVHDEVLPINYPELIAPHCPVDLDPFLPWIHDFFPTPDGKHITFIGQNKRRCKTGKNSVPFLQRLIPQVALFQPISIQRITHDKAQQLAPQLWKPNHNIDDNDGTVDEDIIPTPKYRYRLAPRNESSEDGMYTRFICRFHILDTITTATTSTTDNRKKRIILDETLSVYPFNYEFATYRKKTPSTLLTQKGQDTHILWASTLMFQCPTPRSIQELIKSGETVIGDGNIPTLHVDLIPIRTSARYGMKELYFDDKLAGPKHLWINKGERAMWNNSNSFKKNEYTGFDPIVRWGPNNVLPMIEASGRWSNLPICIPPKPASSSPTSTSTTIGQQQEQHQFKTISKNNYKDNDDNNDNIKIRTKKQHVLSACIWASSFYKTRGANVSPTKDAKERLVEWLLFHFMVGFDHVYLYDNSGAHLPNTTINGLLPIIEEFVNVTGQSGRITYIDWPHSVCNNNVPAHDSTGERSSQYAAENSCRSRFAPYTEWIGSFDTDEYLVPMGDYTNLKDLVKDVEKKGTNILSFLSSRGRFRYDATHTRGRGDARYKYENKSFLETYNCDSAGSPKPHWGNRAKKQLYKSDYVLNHFVHYSTITQGLMETYEEAKIREKKRGKNLDEFWHDTAFRENVVSSTDDSKQAVMVHAKTTDSKQTGNYKRICHWQYPKGFPDCMVGFPWPKTSGIHNDNEKNDRREKDKNDTFYFDPNIGMKYNCFINDKVEHYWVPKLDDALKEYDNNKTKYLVKK